MRRIFLIAAFAAIASSANAISQYNPAGMSCASTKASIERDGAALLRYPSRRTSGLVLFDRYVGSGNSCTGFGELTASSVPTKDDPVCSVSLCRQRMGNNSLH